MPLDDKPTYELLGRGDTLGVFQLDGGPMRDLLRRMQPTEFNDIVAVLALYRPGPMGMNAHNDYADRKNGRQAVKPIHPELEEPLREILAETHGLIVYQEQIMFIAQKVASYTMGKADALRKAMGKKKLEVLEAEYKGFYEGMTANGFSEKAVKALWDTILPFAGYAFNKSHAAGYGLVSYWTAYLKANYPGRVHGRPADVGRRRQGQGRGLPGRLPQARHHGAAAGRQRVAGELRLGGPRHPVRAGRGAQRRRQRRRLADRHPQRARASSPTSRTT